MILNWILVVIILILFVWVFLLVKKNKVTILLQEEFKKELIIEKTKLPLTIWKIIKYNEEDFDLLLNNIDLLDLIISRIEYKISKKTDSIRSLDWVNEKVGFVNCLHEELAFFTKIKQKNTKSKDSIWQTLV